MPPQKNWSQRTKVYGNLHIPGFGWTDVQVGWIALFRIKAMVCQHNHLFFKGLDERMKDSVVSVGCGTVLATHQTFLVEQATELAAHNPALVGVALFSNLLGTAAFATGMQQLHFIATTPSRVVSAKNRSVQARWVWNRRNKRVRSGSFGN